MSEMLQRRSLHCMSIPCSHARRQAPGPSGRETRSESRDTRGGRARRAWHPGAAACGGSVQCLVPRSMAATCSLGATMPRQVEGAQVRTPGMQVCRLATVLPICVGL